MPRNLSNTPERIEKLLCSAMPGCIVESYEILEGGSSNLNVLVRLQGEEAFVLRVYVRNPGACINELALLKSLRGCIPVPEVVKADPLGDEGEEPYLVYRYLEGVTFQSLKNEGSVQDQAEAAFALGRSLALVQGARIESWAALGLKLRPEIDESSLNETLLGERLGAHELTLLQDFLRTWKPRICELYQARFLVHGDFNNRNALLRRQNAGWEVVGILDWEFACVGSPLWDAARFLCYEHSYRPCREPHFSNGFLDHGGQLPDDWTTFARVINTVSATESLNRPDIQPQFIPDLCQVVRDGMRGSSE
jgi:aminoglycoside phosphotransferase (APT) family kinase protein